MNAYEAIVSRLHAGVVAMRSEPASTTLCAIRLRVSDPIDWLGAFARGEELERFYWDRPSCAERILGLGVARAIETAGPERFQAAVSGGDALFDDLTLVGDEGPDDRGPLLLGGFAFADAAPPSEPHAGDDVWRGFPPGRFVLPELLLVARDGECWLTVCLEAEQVADGGDRVLARVTELVAAVFDDSSPGLRAEGATGFDREGPRGMAAGPEYRVRSDRSHADYRAQVEAARAAIAAGDLEKVVLARSLRVRLDGRFDLPGLLRRLTRIYPDCVTFAASRPGVCFLGATPELLVARKGRRVVSGALAGSAARGRTPEDDARRGRELRESKKDQEEHAVVVRAIQEALAPFCESLSLPEAPRLLRLEGIQHLHTPIEGVLRPGPGPTSLIALAERLHPTPAVGGAPRAAAVDWISRCEGFDRGWYAAPLGFVDRAGDGELRVALRSALVRCGDEGDEALLFAGGGIVADSDPHLELEETRIKLRALLAPLTEI